MQYEQQAPYEQYYGQQANLQQLPQYVAAGRVNVPEHPPGWYFILEVGRGHVWLCHAMLDRTLTDS
jgi:hypothetical protein